MVESDVSESVPSDVLAYYNQGTEAGRLFKGIGPLELARSQELITRYLPPAPAVVLDVGGGPGVYACWLATAGYEVHLVDLVPLHVAQANQASRAQPRHPLASVQLGDARHLAFADGIADAVLLHGPLYHLIERDDRLAALREVRRALHSGAIVLAFTISRFASTHVGLTRWWLSDPDYQDMCRRELTVGQHRPPANWPNLFTTAYFHHPNELQSEVEAAGLVHEATLAVQGPGWLVPDFEGLWQDETQREVLLTIIRWLEREPVALGMSAHNMTVARRA